MKWGYSDEEWNQLDSVGRRWAKNRRYAVERLTHKFLQSRGAYLPSYEADEQKRRRTGRWVAPSWYSSALEAIAYEAERSQTLRRKARKYRKIKRKAARLGLTVEQYVLSGRR